MPQSLDVRSEGWGMGTCGTSGEPEWLADLSDPSAYPEPTSRVERIETHISWVFLTDRHAYKIKKAVRFPFLDFRELATRHELCRSEVVLNHRLAPRVYHGVVPIVRARGGRFRVEGKGRAVEWAVKMTRLPADRCLDRVLRMREPTRLEWMELGKTLADFYNRLPPVAIRTSDYAERVERHVRENRAELLNDAYRFERDSVVRSQTAQLALLRILPHLVSDRVGDGRIVEGHGDLRPEHVYLMQPPVIVDCLEFSREFREIDVLDELGFLEMECDRLGAGRAAHRLVDMYASVSGDRYEERALRFYMAYRATVRAKVHALRAAQRDDRGALESLAEARDYLRLADRYADDVMPPMLLAVAGISGSGKSTLAARIAEDLGIDVLRSDAIRGDAPSGRPETNEVDGGRYAPDRRDATYADLIRRAGVRMAAGVSVIVDATFLKRTWREALLDEARRHRTAAWFITCDCPLPIARRRISHRADAMSDAWPDLATDQFARFENDFSGESRIAIDATDCPARQALIVYQHLAMARTKCCD